MVDLVPKQEAVFKILNDSKAYRYGHFVSEKGKHTSHHFQIPIAFHYYDNARILAVGLSRKFRMNRKISSKLPKVSMISPSAGVIPVAFSIREALNAEQVYWAENENGRKKFPDYVSERELYPCIIVDDIVRSGSTMKETFKMVKEAGLKIIGCGVILRFKGAPEEIDGIRIESLTEFDCRSYDTEEEWRAAEGNDSPLEEIRF
ncbi:MAG: hypothetical protein HKN25_08580 [Pyrinomonadaceae bacterium]|nr:hypothetical protein [Pyrinomonadaceae bacterium]